MRAISMTAFAAILALLPLALGIGHGAAMQQPLAIAIISGLIFSLPLVLIILPALLAILEPKRRFTVKLTAVRVSAIRLGRRPKASAYLVQSSAVREIHPALAKARAEIAR